MIDGGTATIFGTGTKILTLPLTPTWMRINIRRFGYKQSTGFIYPTQTWSLPHDSSAASTFPIELRDPSDNIVMQASLVGFATNQVTFNFNINTITAGQQICFEFGN